MMTTGLKVLAVLQDRDGGLWAGTERGLFLDPDAAVGGLPVVQHKAQRDGLINDHVRAHRGRSRRRGLVRHDRRREPVRGWKLASDAVTRSWPANASTRRWSTAPAAPGQAWNATGWRCGMEPVGSVPAALGGVPDNRIVMLFEDAVGRIWVSSGDGVGYFGSTEPQQFTVLPGVPLVYAFEQDGKSGVWLATNDGLYRWNESDWPPACA